MIDLGANLKHDESAFVLFSIENQELPAALVSRVVVLVTIQPPAPPIFSLGLVVATPGAIAALSRSGEGHLHLLSRHQRGDWGNVPPEDAKSNDAAVAHEADEESRQRVLSSYATKLGEKLWIITEHDRSVTTILLPDEY